MAPKRVPGSNENPARVELAPFATIKKFGIIKFEPKLAN